MSHSTFNSDKLFPYKDRHSLFHSVGVVYQLTCSGGPQHLGQTKQNLITRSNEHPTRQSSEFCRHLMENPKHTVNFTHPSFWTEITIAKITYKRIATYCRTSAPVKCR